MRVRDEDEAQSEILRGDGREHRADIRAGVEDGRVARGGIPHEVGVHRHVLVNRVTLLQSFERHVRGCVAFLRDRGERPRIQPEYGRDFFRDRRIEFAAAQGLQVRERHARTLRDRRLVELMPADGFADDVSESVFERNAHVRSKPESRAGCPE